MRASALALLAIVLPACPRAPIRTDRPKVEACIPLRTVAPDDGSFADLAPLKALVSRATVVALGEATHADGTAFLLKSRLVRFLHAEMGFRVLAWEASLWSCEVDASQCLGWPWAETAETKLVRSVPGLRVTGIDVRPTAASLEERCREHPVAIAALVGVPVAAGFFGYQSFRAPWSDVFDAAVVIRQVAPATRE